MEVILYSVALLGVNVTVLYWRNEASLVMPKKVGSGCCQTIITVTIGVQSRLDTSTFREDTEADQAGAGGKTQRNPPEGTMQLGMPASPTERLRRSRCRSRWRGIRRCGCGTEYPGRKLCYR